MPTPRSLRFAAILAVLLAGSAVAGRAQENYNFTVTLLGGAGGAFDADPDPGFANPSFALGLSLVTEPRTHVGLRLAQLDVSGDESFGGVREARLRYGLVTGEYRIDKGYYESGLFAGIGGYQIDGLVAGEALDDTSFGGVVGVSGEFRMTRWLGLQVEASAHYANLEVAQVLFLAHAGFAIHF
jgi:hypothetical protein